MSDFSNFDQDELLALAERSFQNDEHESALQKLKVLLSRPAAPIQSHALAGRVYATLGLFEKAKMAFIHYLQNQPNEHMKVNERFQLGLVERDMGNTDAALHVWDQLLDDYPHHSPTLYHKALVLAELGRHPDAVDLLNLILEKAEDNDNYIQMADQLLGKIALQ